MLKLTPKTHRAFIFGLISLLLLTTLILFAEYYYRLFSDFDTMILLILVSSFGIISILGFTNSIKGIKETNSWKKIIGTTLNVGFVLLFLYGLISFVFYS
jgi:hypothetical protein